MSESNRKQMIVERLLEDERLRGDLTDPAARELLDWATARAAAIAGDPARSDAEVDAEVRELRRATLLAAISGEQEPARVLAHAEAQLAGAPAAQDAPMAGAASRAGGERTSAALATLSDEPKPQAAEDERAVGAATAQPAHTQELHSLEPALRRRRSRLAPLLKRLRGGR
jgi:hypothetical protein